MAAPEIPGAEHSKNKVVYAGKTLIDLTEDTVTPATLKSGVTAHDASGAMITGTLDTAPPKESDINFWDYDGTLLYAWTLAELAGKTELPPLPSHDGLVCQGWNWTLQDIKDAGRELDIGALYITDDGKTRLYVDVDTETWDDFILNYWQSAKNAVTVNWGDGSAEEVGPTSGWITLRHVYGSSGSYMITLAISGGATIQFTNPISDDSEPSRARNSMLTKVELGANVEVSYFAFGMASRMQTFTAPMGTIFSGSRIFERCTALRAFIAPAELPANQTFYNSAALRIVSTVKGNVIGNSFFNTAITRLNCDLTTANQVQALERVHIKAVNGQVRNFSACRSLLEVTIPADATTFVAGAFRSDDVLRRVTCLGDIASIPAQVFQRCYSLRFVDLTHCTAVPTLANVDAFDETHPQLEIRVPASLAAAWKAATNWSSLADHIVGV